MFLGQLRMGARQAKNAPLPHPLQKIAENCYKMVQKMAKTCCLAEFFLSRIVGTPNPPNEKYLLNSI